MHLIGETIWNKHCTRRNCFTYQNGLDAIHLHYLCDCQMAVISTFVQYSVWYCVYRRMV